MHSYYTAGKVMLLSCYHVCQKLGKAESEYAMKMICCINDQGIWLRTGLSIHTFSFAVLSTSALFPCCALVRVRLPRLSSFSCLNFSSGSNHNLLCYSLANLLESDTVLQSSVTAHMTWLVPPHPALHRPWALAIAHQQIIMLNVECPASFYTH